MTKTPPHNRFFLGHNRDSPTAVYVKLFGHNTDGVNAVQVRWGLIDGEDLRRFGGMGEDNLTLTSEDKVQLTLQILHAAKSPHAQLSPATRLAATSSSLGDILQFLETSSSPSQRI